MQQKGVIKKAISCPGQFISSVFIRPKKDGSFQMILNLKQLNAITILKWRHTFQSALTLVKPGSYMAFPVKKTILLLQSLGFFIHETKSYLEASQEVKFLRFLINSVRMYVSMTSDKAGKVSQACYALLKKGLVPKTSVLSSTGSAYSLKFSRGILWRTILPATCAIRYDNF